MKEPTKADLAAAVAKLTQENAGLRDLLAAVSECARSVPQAAGRESYFKELHRATGVLSRIGLTADPGGSWAWGHANGGAAKYLRECAAEPPGYEVYVKPEDASPEPASRRYCESMAPNSLRRCTEQGPHDRHRNGMVVWGPGVTEPDRDQPASPDAAEALIDAIVAGTPVKVTDDRCECGHPARVHNFADVGTRGFCHECDAGSCKQYRDAGDVAVTA